MTPTSVRATALAAAPETTILRLGGGLGFVVTLLRPAAGNRVIGPGAQINENVIKIAHHVAIGAERRHHALLRRADVLASVHDNAGVVRETHGLQRIAQRRAIGRSFTVRTVTDMAIRMIAAVAGIGEPIYRSVRLHFVGRIILLVVILAIFVLDRRRIARTVGEYEPGSGRTRGQHDSHHQSSHGHASLCFLSTRLAALVWV